MRAGGRLNQRSRRRIELVRAGGGLNQSEQEADWISASWRGHVSLSRIVIESVRAGGGSNQYVLLTVCGTPLRCLPCLYSAHHTTPVSTPIRAVLRLLHTLSTPIRANVLPSSLQFAARKHKILRNHKSVRGRAW